MSSSTPMNFEKLSAIQNVECHSVCPIDNAIFVFFDVVVVVVVTTYHGIGEDPIDLTKRQCPNADAVASP